MRISLKDRPVFLKILMTLAANLVIGFAMGLMHTMNVGADPITVLIGGLARSCSISEGTAATILNGCFFLFVFLLNRDDIRCATVISIFTLGTFMDLALFCIHKFIPQDLSYWVRVVISAVSSAAMGASIGFYLFLQIGASPTDGVMRWVHKTFRLPYRYCTWSFYGVAMIVGYLLGGKVGIGTILSLYFVGKSCDAMNALLTGIDKPKSKPIPTAVPK